MSTSEWVMLAEPWSIGDPGSPGFVDDVEKLCRGVIRELVGGRTPTGKRDLNTRRSEGGRIQLEQVEYEDSMLFLLAETVELQHVFEDRPGILFRPWLYQRLRWALIDEWRSPRMFGRHGQHRVPRSDGVADGRHPDEPDYGDESGRDLRGGRLRVAAAGDPADRTDADRWLDPDGDRHTDRDVGRAGVAPSPAVAGVAARAGAGTGGGAGAEAAGACGVAAPFLDCEACGWRHYAQSPNGIAVWHFPAGCLACGAALAVEAAA